MQNESHEATTHPTTVSADPTTAPRDDPLMGSLLSEFARHRQTRMGKKAVEGWEAELRRYLREPEPDLTSPHFDVVKWWQVRRVLFHFRK